MGIIYLTLAFLLNSLANVLMKLSSAKGLVLSGTLLHILKENIFLFLALLSFVLNFIFYFFALKRLNLSLAYPIMNGMSIAIIYGFSLWFFQEKLTWQQTVGYGLLLIGLIFIFSFQNKS